MSSEQGASCGLLDGLPAAGGAAQSTDWLSALRLDAATAVRERGLPDRRREAWRLTPIKPIVEGRYASASQGQVPAWVTERLAQDADTQRIFVVNGKPIVSDEELAEGIEISALSALAAGQGTESAGQMASVAPRAEFSALNTAMFADGLLVRIRKGTAVEKPLELVHVAVGQSDDSVCYPRVMVVCEPHSQAVVIETFVADSSAHAPDAGRVFINAVTELVLQSSSVLEHVRVQLGGPASHHIGMVAARLGAHSVLRSRSISLGGRFARVDVRVQLAGEGAECELDGAYHAVDREFVDHHTHIDHTVPRCSSRETYRGIIDGSGHAVFDAITAVRRDAQQSSAHQENRNLLLSDNATVHTKPHLEIDADDIVASHGATVGALDDDQLFYLRARGLDEATARAALTYGFVQEILGRIRCEPISLWLGGLLRDRLHEGAFVEELLA